MNPLNDPRYSSTAATVLIARPPGGEPGWRVRTAMAEEAKSRALRDEFLGLCQSQADVSVSGHRLRGGSRWSGAWLWGVGCGYYHEWHIPFVQVLRSSSMHEGMEYSLMLACYFLLQGLRNEVLKQHFGDRYAQLVPVINMLLQEVGVMSMEIGSQVPGTDGIWRTRAIRPSQASSCS
jgi:hypothetical protein